MRFHFCLKHRLIDDWWADESDIFHIIRKEYGVIIEHDVLRCVVILLSFECDLIKVHTAVMALLELEAAEISTYVLCCPSDGCRDFINWTRRFSHSRYCKNHIHLLISRLLYQYLCFFSVCFYFTDYPVCLYQDRHTVLWEVLCIVWKLFMFK